MLVKGVLWILIFGQSVPCVETSKIITFKVHILENLFS